MVPVIGDWEEDREIKSHTRYQVTLPDSERAFITNCGAGNPQRTSEWHVTREKDGDSERTWGDSSYRTAEEALAALQEEFR